MQVLINLCAEFETIRNAYCLATRLFSAGSGNRDFVGWVRPRGRNPPSDLESVGYAPLTHPTMSVHSNAEWNYAHSRTARPLITALQVRRNPRKQRSVALPLALMGYGARLACWVARMVRAHPPHPTPPRALGKPE